MGDKVFRALSLWKEKYDQSDKVTQFRLMTGLYYGAEYELGSEHSLKTDCSGLICGAFTLMGHPIRVTADDLKKLVFVLPSNSRFDQNRIKVVFFNNDRGRATHVGIIAGENVLYHSSSGDGPHYEDLNDVVKRYKKLGLMPEYRELSWVNLEKHTGEVYGLDEELE